MELNFNGITVSLGGEFIPPSESLHEFYCSNCEETYVVSEIAHRNLCSVCGTSMSKKQANQSNEASLRHASSGTPGASQAQRWTSIIDFLGEDVREMLNTANVMQAPDRALSEMSVKALSRCTVDASRAILSDCVISMGPLQVMLIPANFSAQSNGVCHNLELVVGQPEFGEAHLTNAAFVPGRVLLLRRGRVSFAAKYKVAISAGAAALIIVQTLDIWPFVMTDTIGELAGCTPSIPCFMVSKADGQLLERLYPQAPLGHKDRSIGCALTISVFPPINECSICQEELCHNDVVLKLLCRHVYHEHCVSDWLRSKNTCPLCRGKLPSDASSAKSSDTPLLYA